MFTLFSTEACDKMQTDLIKAKESLTKILSSKDVKAMVYCALLLPSIGFDILSILHCLIEIILSRNAVTRDGWAQWAQ